MRFGPYSADHHFPVFHQQHPLQLFPGKKINRFVFRNITFSVIAAVEDRQRSFDSQKLFFFDLWRDIFEFGVDPVQQELDLIAGDAFRNGCPFSIGFCNSSFRLFIVSRIFFSR